MIHELMPWSKLTRNGIPALRVIRRPLEVGQTTVQVGEVLDPTLFSEAIRKVRLRQFYEARRLEPVDPPIDTKQYYRDLRARLAAEPEPVAPITPVASQIVAGLPAVDVPVLDDPQASTRQPQRTQPRKR